MSAITLATPIRYRADVEQPEEDEAATDAALRHTLQGIGETTFRHSGQALRCVHAKSHGLLRGELLVSDNLPSELAQGLFAAPATYPVVLRYSTSPGDLLADSVSGIRGLAIKVIGVPGERLPDAAGETQDFVLEDAPSFSTPTARAFLASLKMLAATTDRAEGAKKLLSAALRGLESLVESVSGPSTTLKTMGGQPPLHILGETFYSQTPIRYGEHIAKVAVAPVSPELVALAGRKLDLSASPDALREAVRTFFAAQGGEWELRVQLCTDLETMPVEDSSVVWPEDQSPYRAVARISVPPQPAWTEARSAVVDDQLAFSPWHGLAAHRPLGSINRVRRAAYAMSAGLRAKLGGCPIHEPTPATMLPG